MVKVPVYNQEGKELETITLHDAVFAVPMNPSVLQEAVVTHEANNRLGLAHTKTRSEVRGGGKKPWRQKGTGRARHGSIRSPLWRGGGITFGPRNNRNWDKKANHKLLRKAVAIALTDKVKQKKFIVLDTLTLKDHKTKQIVHMLAKLPRVRSAMLICDTMTDNIKRATKNLPHVALVAPRNLHAYDLLQYDGCIVTKKAVGMLTDHLKK